MRLRKRRWCHPHLNASVLGFLVIFAVPIPLDDSSVWGDPIIALWITHGFVLGALALFFTLRFAVDVRDSGGLVMSDADIIGAVMLLRTLDAKISNAGVTELDGYKERHDAVLQILAATPAQGLNGIIAKVAYRWRLMFRRAWRHCGVKKPTALKAALDIDSRWRPFISVGGVTNSRPPSP
jgi:hypothetical protein